MRGKRKKKPTKQTTIPNACLSFVKDLISSFITSAINIIDQISVPAVGRLGSEVVEVASGNGKRKWKKHTALSLQLSLVSWAAVLSVPLARGAREGSNLKTKP